MGAYQAMIATQSTTRNGDKNNKDSNLSRYKLKESNP